MNPVRLGEANKWELINQKRLERLTSEAFEKFGSIGLNPIVIKGAAAASFYPEHQPRRFFDIDLAFHRDEFPAAMELAESEHRFGTHIDVHLELRSLDSLTWPELFARSTFLELEFGSIRVLCPEDHLRVIAVHWLNDGGENRERLWDIYCAVANRPTDFDWSKCLDCVSETRRGWVITAIGLAHKYLDLDISDLPFREECENIPKWVTRTLEREWADPVRTRPLQSCLRQPKLFLKQLRKRIPPNPIQASIQTESPINDGSRFFVQIRNIANRSVPSLERITKVIRRKDSR